MPVRKRRALAETVSRLLESVEDEEERIEAGRPSVTQSTTRTNCYTVEMAKRSIIEHALNMTGDENRDQTDIEVSRNGYTLTVTVRAMEMGFLDALECQLPALYAEWTRSSPQRDADAPQQADFADAFRASRNTLAGELDLET